ncbi:hypothetical protein [Streptococcus merionis]|uniref:hypothetical protein n=1 Tax=Streptococcus merionis TaxID=400065 RepID=UPI00351687E8
MRIPIWLIIIILIVGGVFYLVQKPKQDKALQELKDEGLYKERDKICVRQRHTFYSRTIDNLDVVYQAMKKDHLEEVKLPLDYFKTYSDKQDGVYFFRVRTALGGDKSGGLFLLEQVDSDTESYVYQFYLNTAYDGKIDSLSLACNLILTSLENAFKSLDSNIEVERKVNEFS